MSSTDREPSPLVLVVEDEAPVRKFLLAALKAHGYRVEEAESSNQGLRVVVTKTPDLILLDLGLPDGDGLAFTRDVRAWSHVPIVVVSARQHEEDKVAAFEAGADDYLTKPFGVAELLARLTVALRHASRAQGPPAPRVLEIGPIRVDRDRREVRVDRKAVHLTPTEYDVLVLLAENAGKVVTHRHILTSVWGGAHADNTHYVRVQIAELRKKIEGDPARPQWLVTEPGVGYRLRDHD